MTLIVVGLGWVAGLVAVGAFGAPWWMGGAWAAASVPVALRTGILRGRSAATATAVAAGLVSGWLLAGAETAAPTWAALAGREVVLTGEVVSEPDRGDTTTAYTVRVRSIEPTSSDATAPDDGSSSGKVLLYLHQYAKHLPGDRVTVRGDLELPPEFEGFDYGAYLAGQGISAVMYRPEIIESSAGGGSVTRWLTDARLRLDRALQRSLPEPAASLAAGIAFGRDDGLSMEAKERYNQSGLRHLVAVSGSNVSLVAALTYALAIPLAGRRWAWLPAAVTIGAYLCAAGLSASVFRAGIMAGVLLAGSVAGRPQSGLPALFAAVMLMTVLDPRLALEPGFQLSATATAGLITLSPWLRHWLLQATSRMGPASAPAWVCEALALTLAASIATAPIMWVTFEQVSLISPLANAVVQPVFAVAFWLSIATAVIGVFSTTAGEVAGAAAYYPLSFIAGAGRLFASPSWAAVPVGGASREAALLGYALLAGAALYAYRRVAPSPVEPPQVAHRRQRAQRLVLAGSGGALALAVIPVSLVSGGHSGDLRVHFLDVGQGDGILVVTPRGKQVLIDGGPSGTRLARELGGVMAHWDRSLDAIVLTHPQEDHVAGLVETYERFAVADSYANGFANQTISHGEYERRRGQSRVLVAGDEFTIDDVAFRVLWPEAGFETENLNDSSLVLRVTYGEVTFLLTGDSEAAVHERLARADLRADVLKVPHHGSKTTDPSFFSAVEPALAVISAGEQNVYGHPHPDTLAALAGTRIYRTDVDGRITVRTDGNTVRVATER